MKTLFEKKLMKFLKVEKMALATFATAKIGITRGMFYDYFRGRKEPTPDIARKIVEETRGTLTLDIIYGTPKIKINQN